MSDGKETDPPPYIDDVKDEVVAAGVIVDVVAFEQGAEEKIFELAVLTGNLFFSSSSSFRKFFS